MKCFLAGLREKHKWGRSGRRKRKNETLKQPGFSCFVIRIFSFRRISIPSEQLVENINFLMKKLIVNKVRRFFKHFRQNIFHGKSSVENNVFSCGVQIASPCYIKLNQALTQSLSWFNYIFFNSFHEFVIVIFMDVIFIFRN